MTLEKNKSLLSLLKMYEQLLFIIINMILTFPKEIEGFPVAMQLVHQICSSLECYYLTDGK